jgi:ribosomal protein S13
MKIRFQRVKSGLGFGVAMKIIINDEVIYRLKNGEVFEYEVDKVNSILIKTHRFINDLTIPTDDFKESVDILLQYTYGICKNSTQAIISENGKLLGVYPQERIDGKK